MNASPLWRCCSGVVALKVSAGLVLVFGPPVRAVKAVREAAVLQTPSRWPQHIKIRPLRPIQAVSPFTGTTVDVSPAAMVGAYVSNKQASSAQEVQLAVLKKAMDMQGSSMLSLLQGVTGNLPLATGGSVGTQLNLLA